MDDDAAVGAVGGLELEVEDEVVIFLLRPDRLVLGGGEHPIIVAGPDAGGEFGIAEIIGEQRLPGLASGVRVLVGFGVTLVLVGDGDRDDGGGEQEGCEGARGVNFIIPEF